MANVEASNYVWRSLIVELDKVVRIGRGQCGNVFCHIQFKDGKLSITGVEGPQRNGNCTGSCGQINMSLTAKDISPAPGWSPEMLSQFFDVWERWHLNNMRAGSPIQEEWLKDNPIPKEEYAYPKSHYEVAAAYLQRAGLNPDGDGYLYGHEWKTEEVPKDVLAFLSSLPDSDMKPAWI